MSSISGSMNLKHEDLWQDEVSNAGQPSAITVHSIYFPGTSLPTTSGLQRNVPISFGGMGSKDTISSLEAHRRTGIPKRDLDTWADLIPPINVGTSWSFCDQDTPVFTTLFILVRGSGSIEFSQNINQERCHANRTQDSSILSPDFYTIAMPPQIQYRPAPCCATCGRRRSARSKRHRAVSDHQCRAAADPSSDAARQVPHRLLEASRRHGTDVFMRTGATNGLQETRDLRQRMLTADLRRVQDTWQSPR